MSVAKEHVDRATMQEDFDLVSALLKGTRGMRGQGERYLPKRPMEEKDDYSKRLNLATLYPAFIETVKTMVGRAFARPIIITDKVPAWIRDDVLPDCDMRGRNFHVFLSEWFRQAFAFGLSHVLVDSPKAEGVITLADQKAANIRPYLIRINPWDVLGWRINEKGIMEQLRLRFWRTEMVGDFDVKYIEQVRVYEMKGITTYERKSEKSEDWIAVGDVLPLPLPRIPFITLYTKRSGDMSAEPPMRELAYLNVKHWNMQSGNDALVDTASVPILALSGVDSGDSVVIGAKHAVKLPTGATMAYVEHTGAAIGTGREALNALKQEMVDAGAKLLQSDSVAKNELQAGQEAARENSQLGEMVQAMQDTANDVLDLIAEWRGEATGGTIKMQANLEADFAPVETMNVVITLRDAGILSSETVFHEAKRRSIIAEDNEWEAEQERMANDLPPPAPLPPAPLPPPDPVIAPAAGA